MDLWDTRLQLHWAAQPAAGVGRTLGPHLADFSQSGVWNTGGWVGVVMDDGDNLAGAIAHCRRMLA